MGAPERSRPICSMVTGRPPGVNGVSHAGVRHDGAVSQRERADQPIRDLLRTRVAELEPGQRLPPERELAREYGVARMTLRGVIAELAREGLVRSVHGSGTWRSPTPIPLRVQLGSFAHALSVQGVHTRTELLTDEVAAAPEPAATVLGLGPGQPARHLRRLRIGDDVPLALESAWFRAELVEELGPEEATGSLYGFLERRDLLPDHGYETVTAGLPGPEECRLLALAPGRPVLRLERRALHGTLPVEYATAVFPADRYELHFPLAGPLPPA